MHYAISDIHGCYDKYISMLEKIGFNDGDTLYFLGDAVDRGPDGVKILLDMMERKNVVPLLGNHEDTFYVMINSLRKTLSAEEQIGVEAEKFAWLVCDGGRFTWDAYCALPKEAKKNLLRYLKTFELCDKIRVNNRTFLLSHAGLGDYAPGKTLADCTADDLLWGRMDYERVYCPGTYIVSGHTPTGYIDPACAGKTTILPLTAVLSSEAPSAAFVWKRWRNFTVDCLNDFAYGSIAGCNFALLQALSIIQWKYRCCS